MDDFLTFDEFIEIDSIFNQTLQQILDYCCLDEAYDEVIKSKKELEKELLKLKLNLEKFFEGSLPKSKKPNQKCNPKIDSFYVHVFKQGQHVVEIRISGHIFANSRKEAYKINEKKYNMLYIDISKMFDEVKYQLDFLALKQYVKTKIDYVYLNHTTYKVIYAIMNVIMNYLLSNDLAKATKDRLQIQWSVGEV